MLIPYADDNPTAIAPVLTIVLIAACGLVFLYQLGLQGRAAERFVLGFGMVPAVVFGETRLPAGIPTLPSWLTVLSSMFLHGGILHLAGNMLYLWVFGNNIEDAMGHGRFLVFYLLCGIAAAMTQALADPASSVPMIGASGAISGVLGAYLVLHPRAKIRVFLFLGVFFTRFNLAALWVLGWWIVVQFANLMMAGEGEGGVAWYAHIGGFFAGMALIPAFRRKNVPLFAGGRRVGPWERRGPWG
ncbi:MAG: rhomboid family intramembrane serine protease [Pseudomonadota bacterium]